jgi:hypothetical protein
VHAGLRIPGAVQHDIRHFRVEILTVQHIAFHGVNARPVAGDQKRIQGKRAQQMAHLQHMAAGGKRQGDITLAQALQRVQGFSLNGDPALTAYRPYQMQRAGHDYSRNVMRLTCASVLPEIYGSNSE